MSTLTDVQLANQTSTDPPPLDTIEQHETASRVLKMLDALPVAQREVLRLKFQNGFSYEEISRITGKSISNVGVLIHNGIKTIRSQVVEPAATNQAL